MSAVGNPYDNAKAKSFFKTLKQEEVYLKEYCSFEEAEQNLTEFYASLQRHRPHKWEGEKGSPLPDPPATCAAGLPQAPSRTQVHAQSMLPGYRESPLGDHSRSH
ncbi:integrase core domain-containing protein [Dictyobacter aurantiacus]|uniref:integrase core domain-containing protein n=1 Tax=Dictyobacter aurantiacus TaxID=1936993 RepID=UPI003530D10E